MSLRRIFCISSLVMGAVMLTSCQMWSPAGEDLEIDSAAEQVVPDSSSTPQVQVGLFELSGSAVVPEGVLLADDELIGSVYFTPHSASGDLILSPVKIERKRKDSAPFTTDLKLFAVQDVEGLAADHDAIYLVGSHHAHSSDDRRSDREFLIWAKWEWDGDDGELRSKEQYSSLLSDIAEELTKKGLEVTITDTTVTPNINIEGLAANDGVLFVGLREPLLNENAILLEVEAKGLFSGSPQFTLWSLALDGAGIRGLHWDVNNDRLLVLSGGKDDSGDIDAEIVPGIWEVTPGESQAELVHSFTAHQLGAPAGEERAKPEALSLFSDGRIAVFLDGESDAAANVRVLYLNP